MSKLTGSTVVMLLLGVHLSGQVCRISTSGVNRNRRVAGPVHAECPISVHSVPFGNWGVTSNFGQKVNGHQFQGWCHDTRICDNRGNCRTDCQDGWYEWNSCTDISEYRAPNCTLYNDKDCTAQASPLGDNVHGTRSVDVTVRCPSDTSGDGISDEGGCADVKSFSNGTNFMSLYELDPGTGDDLVQTMYFPETPVFLACGPFGCPAARSPWATPFAFDSPVTPAIATAEFAMMVNSAIFIDTGRSCRAVGPAVTTVSGASFRGPAVAPESIVSAFGVALAVGVGDATGFPLPVELAGTRVMVTDSAGVTRLAGLYHVAPEQTNFLIPAGTAVGAAQVTISRTDTVQSRGTVQVAAVAPSLFSADADGDGVAAATAVLVDAAGRVAPVAVIECGGNPRTCSGVPIGLDGGAVYVSLYGTGLRGHRGLVNVAVTVGGVPAEVFYAGPQPQYAGLDQVNVRVPESVRGGGVVEVRLMVAGVAANVVSLTVR